MAPYDAGVIFADVCLTRGSAFQNAREGLQGFPFTQNAATGTFYHNTRNLSVKVTDKTCSLVFATDKSINDTVRELAKGSASLAPQPPQGVKVTSSKAADGNTYFRLGINAKS